MAVEIQAVDREKRVRQFIAEARQIVSRKVDFAVNVFGD